MQPRGRANSPAGTCSYSWIQNTSREEAQRICLRASDVVCYGAEVQKASRPGTEEDSSITDTFTILALTTESSVYHTSP